MGQGFSQASDATTEKSASASLVPAAECEHMHQQMQMHFGSLADPRGNQGVLHPFISIVMIALLATIGGAQGWEDIEVYGISHQRWLSSFFSLALGDSEGRYLSMR